MEGKENRLFFKLASVQIIPLAALVAVVMAISMIILSRNMENEIESKLAGYARIAARVIRDEDPGRFEIRDGRFYIGETDRTGVNSIVDKFKQNTGAEYTVFAGRTRVLSTVNGENGDRIVGTDLESDEIYRAVMSGEEYYAKDIEAMGKSFYAYYVPYYSGGEICGIVLAGESSQNVREGTNTVVRLIMIVFLMTLLLAVMIWIFYSRKMSNQLRAIKNYIGGLSTSKFDVHMDESVLARGDEIGELGRYAVEVGNVVRNLIDTDPLTGIFNRRAGEAEFTSLLAADAEGGAYIAAMLDIDFFKKLNDRFGHDYGDKVLVGVSDIIRQYVTAKGFVCRWGGEEFLMGMRCTEFEALECFRSILSDIRAISEEDGRPTVTATIGAAVYDAPRDMYEMINCSDECLYKGKNGGRDRIVIYKADDGGGTEKVFR
ncbi:MAG: diguanylate cyclase [Ruminococcus sp.]|nr:diguanylate cyclase [Ruminococcus sp.]